MSEEKTKPKIVEKQPIAGIYRATVVDNVDTKNRGRVKVLIHGINDPTTPPNLLPWAEPFQPVGGNPSINSLYIMPKDTTCFVGFINGQKEQPVIVGYWRQGNRPIPEPTPKDVSKYANVRDAALWFIKLGNQNTSPVLEFNSITERITFIAGDNIHTIGSSADTQADKGKAWQKLNSTEATQGFKLSPLNLFSIGKIVVGLVRHNDQSSSYKTTGEMEITSLKKRTANIGGGIKESKQFLLEATGVKDMLDGWTSNLNSIPIVGPYLGTKMQGLLNKMAGGVMDPKKSIFHNLVNNIRKQNPKKSVDEVKAVTNDAFKLMPNGSRAAKNLLNSRVSNGGLKNALLSQGAVKNIKQNIQDRIKGGFIGGPILDETNVKGGSLLDVKGRRIINSHSSKAETIKNGYNLKAKNFKITLTGLSTKNFLVETVGGGIDLTCGMGKNVKIHGPAGAMDYLVKKVAFNDLLTMVSDLLSWCELHIHECTAPGAPTSPPTIPPFEDMAENIADKIKDSLPNNNILPLSPYFTSFLKAT